MNLKVLEAYARDVGHGVARIDYDIMDKLNCKTGDVLKLINIKTNNFTVGKILPLYPSDECKGIIRMDDLIRRNINVQVADEIQVSKAKAERGEYVVVSPLESIPPIDERYLADVLESIPIIVGDHVVIPYFGGRINFKIEEVRPPGIVIVTQRTQFIIVDGAETIVYTKIGKAFKEKEDTLRKELEQLVSQDYTDDIAQKIIELDSQITSIQNVRKIAYRVLTEKEKEK